MKGKDHKTTAANLMLSEEPEESRPLTADPMDNVIVYEEDVPGAPGDERRGDMGETVRGVRHDLPQFADPQGQSAGGGDISPAITASGEICVYEGECDRDREPGENG